VEAARKAILNISFHVFGEHGDCDSSWCHAKNNPRYILKHLLGKKIFSSPAFHVDLDLILADQAAQAEQQAPMGYSLQNESFNHMCNF